MARGLDELLPRADQQRVLAAIRAAEAASSGQVKVHLDDVDGGDAMARAEELFARLGLARTRHRNAVLVYVAPRSRRFAVLGDEGIHGRGGAELWRRAAAALRQGCARGAIGDGLVGAIEAVGEVLAREFPPGAGAGNEIPDAISTGAKDQAEAREDK
jgi:hypothetical protein